MKIMNVVDLLMLFSKYQSEETNQNFVDKIEILSFLANR